MSRPFACSLSRITHGFDHQTCWVQARVGVMPGTPPVAIVTTQKLLLSGSDVFSELCQTRSTDDGQTWSPITPIPGLGRWKEDDGIEGIVCDATPRWHAASGKLLVTGHVARYQGDALMPAPRPREVAYAIHDPATNQWTGPKFLQTPDDPRYFSCGAGSGERVDLPDGDILLPVYLKAAAGDVRPYAAAAIRCGFDGHTLIFKEIGSSQTIDIKRGLYEPSIIRHGGRFFMTMRNDDAGYVAVSDDGLHYSTPKQWTFDDGLPLGNYNTQQHWSSHSHGLYLVYTRRGLNNDHIFRHRAPLAIAQVDPTNLVVKRSTERIIIPQRGARLGNFSVLDINDHETWVVAAEWMQNAGMKENPNICTQYGSDNTIFLARLHWPSEAPPETPQVPGSDP